MTVSRPSEAPGETTPLVFAARDITKVYHMGEVDVHALRGVSLDLYESEFLVLLGPSGSGKSTLLNILGGLDVPTSGTVTYRGQNLTTADERALTMYRRKHVGFVFQFYNLIPSLTARENVALVTDLVARPMAPEEALRLVNMGERLDHFPSQLSGGEQQRVAIARAVAKRPDVLLCDEPTGALDIATGILVLEAIDQVNRELGTTTAVITHNAAVAAMADRVVVLSDGRIASARRNERKVMASELELVIAPLDRKLLRDLWNLKGQAIAISMVIGAGVAMFIMYLSTFHSLRLTQETYYERYRFAHVFAGLTRAPLSLRERAAEIPGVARADARVVVDVTLDIPGMSEPASGRLIGIPVPQAPMLNDVFLRRGRFPAAGRPEEVLVSEGFALARGVEPGNRVGAIINGRRRELEIVGIALSPEYVFNIRPGELMPDDSRFGVFWIDGRSLAAAFNMEGGFNNLGLTLLPDASAPDVIARLDRVLASFGGLGAIPRALQTSHWFLDNELSQLQGVGLVLPIVFLIVAAFLLNVVLTRIVSVQREQIAALKALGYTNLEIAWHYTKLSLVIGAAGAAIGTAGGSWLGFGMTSIYNDLFRFPTLRYRLPPGVVAGGIAVSFVAAILGALNAVRMAAALPPAEAMRPEAPARYQRSWLERAGLARWLSAPVRMILRNVGRHPIRAATSVVGIAASVAMLVLGTFFLDSIDVLMDLQFNVIQRQDVTVTFVLPASGRALHEMRRLPGVIHAEPMRAVPSRLRASQRSRIVSINGLVANPELNRVIDVEAGALRLPADGLVLSLKLAEVLGVGRGDLVTVEVLDGLRPVRQIPVAGIVEEYMGTSAYMEIGALRRLVREGDTLSGAYLKVDAAHVDSLYRRLKATPVVAGVSLKRAAIESFEKTLAESFYIMIFFNLLFSGVIAFGVVYNAARVALSERSRELASLRVLGFTRGEISFILLGELAVVTIMAIPIGLLSGYVFAGALVTAFNTELYRFPLYISVRTYAYAASAVLVAATLSGLAVRRRLDHLDLVAVLKTRE